MLIRDGRLTIQLVGNRTRVGYNKEDLNERNLIYWFAEREWRGA